ncbi:MAG: hypothetical protein VX589_05045 [Myxococcota bacterium]|nr:hypothetical protein [Myxococcota bacterium]
MRIFGLVTGVLLLVGGFLLGGAPSNMFDGPALTIAVLCPLAFTLMAHGPDLWRAIGVGVLNRAVERDTGLYYAKILDTLRRTMLWTGFAAALIGAINMSQGMDSWAHFGPAFAVLLLSPFYGIVMAELLVAPVISRLEAQSH